jgi:hypothetical protein
MKGTIASIMFAAVARAEFVDKKSFSAEDTNFDTGEMFGSTGCTLTGGAAVRVRNIHCV